MGEAKRTEQARSEALIAQQKKLKEAFVAVAATEEGLEVFRHIRKVCGYGLPAVVSDNTGAINVNSSMHNAALQVPYCVIRQMLPKQALIKIELNEIKEG